MKGASKVIMGATLAMVVTLAVVLSLILVLLAQLYCSLLLRRRQVRLTSPKTANTSTVTASSATANITSCPARQQHNQPASSPLTTYYAPGVLQAPRNVLFPVVSCKENEEVAGNNQQFKLHQVLEIQAQESTTFSKDVGLRGISPSCPSYLTSPVQIQEIPNQIRTSNASLDKACAGDKEHLVYISNPIYDNDAGPPSRVDTPFETPNSSPSRFETGGSSSSSGDEREDMVKAELPQHCPQPLLDTPPLTPMKKLPVEACSVSLRDARSLGTSGSDSVSNNGLSSSSSGSPCTSRSW